MPKHIPAIGVTGAGTGDTMNFIEGMTRQDFVRIMTEGPVDFREALWLYLYQQGLFVTPLSWNLALLIDGIGRAVLPMITAIVGNVRSAGTGDTFDDWRKQ